MPHVAATSGHKYIVSHTAGEWGSTGKAASGRVPGAVISWRFSETCARAEVVEVKERGTTGTADRGTSMPVRGLWTKRRARRRGGLVGSHGNENGDGRRLADRLIAWQISK